MLPFWIILSLLLAALPANAQPDSLWSARFGDDGFDIQYHQAFMKDPDSDDMIFVREHPTIDDGTHNYLTRVTSDGQLVWEHQIVFQANSNNIQSLIKTSAGLYAMVGGSPLQAAECDVIFTMMNEIGEIYSINIYRNPPSDHGLSLIETADGGFAISGYFGRAVDGNYQWDVWLIRTDSNGDTLWTRTYGTPYLDEAAYAITETVNGDFLMAGITGLDGMLMMVSERGDSLWSHSFGGNGMDEFLGILPIGNDQFLIYGDTESLDNGVDGWAMVVDGNGELVWEHRYGGAGGDAFRGGIVSSDGDYVLTGVTQSLGDLAGDFWLCKLNLVGEITWQTRFGGDGRDDANSVTQLSDGSFAVIGTTGSFGAMMGDVFLVKTTRDPSLISNFTIQLHRGWNLISSPIVPRFPDIPQMLNGELFRANVDLVKDQGGKFYLPIRNYCNMDEWDVRQAYLLHMLADDSLIIQGSPAAPMLPIPIRQGCNLVSYLPSAKVEAREAVVNMGDDFVLIKNARGGFYERASGFSNIGRLQQGEGYNLRSNRETQLVWYVPPEEEQGDATEETVAAQPIHFETVVPLESNMSLLLEPSNELGRYLEVGFFSSGDQIAGSMSLTTGKINGTAVWGDDPATTIKDGLTEGELISVKGWDGWIEQALQIRWTNGDGRYHADGLARGSVEGALSELQPNAVNLVSAWPNPFNGSTLIKYSLSADGPVKIRVTNLSGATVANLADDRVTAGTHEIVWNAGSLPSGIYILRLSASGAERASRLVLVK